MSQGKMGAVRICIIEGHSLVGIEVKDFMSVFDSSEFSIHTKNSRKWIRYESNSN